MREMRAFSKQVNAAIGDPGFITSVRKKLALDQREAAEIFGGGINAFSRYENGKTKPSQALVTCSRCLSGARALRTSTRPLPTGRPVQQTALQSGFFNQITLKP